MAPKSSGQKTRWLLPPSGLSLVEDEVHVWRVPLTQPPHYVEQLARTLSPDEQRRAKRFQFEAHRTDYIICRGVLRALLSRYVGLPPDRLQFSYSSHGKPSLAGPGELHFNLSHSGRLALYAVALHRRVGIDLEYIRPQVDYEQITTRFFSSEEAEAFQSLPPHLRRQAFFTGWTRKEAYMKAKGDGLSLPLHQFTVSIHPEQPPVLLKAGPDPDEAARWSLRDLTPGPGYVAALAVEGQEWRLVSLAFINAATLSNGP
jgi:4'-phosphopantetheinyl transferase